MKTWATFLLPSGCALLLGCAGQGVSPASSPALGLDAASIVQQCDRRVPPERTACYESALLALLRSEGIRPAMQTLEEIGRRSEAVRRDGHVYAHAIGLAAYTTSDEVGQRYAQCTPAFQSGCYHGVIQSYFADHASQHGPEHLDRETVNAVCSDIRSDPASRWQLFQCAHGIGHGLTMVFDHHLPRALAGCDLIASPWEREGCYGGAFMENLVQATAPHHTVGRPNMEQGASEHGGHDHHGAQASSAEPFKPLDPEDPLYPCNVLEARYLNSCYQMQTSAILFFNRGQMDVAVEACDKAPEQFQSTCYQSLGRDISAYTVQNHAEAVRLCSKGNPQHQPSCHAGYAKNLVDLTARAGDGFSYCRSIPDPGSKSRCYQAVGEEIWVLAADASQQEALCNDAEPDYRGFCRRGAGLPEARE